MLGFAKPDGILALFLGLGFVSIVGIRIYD